MVIPSNINFDPENKGALKGQPSSGKNFEKVLRKERHEERQQDSGKKFKPVDESDVTTKDEFDEVLAKGEAAHAKKTGTTLFDVIEGKIDGEIPEEDTVMVTEIPPEMSKESLSALFEGLGTKEKLKMMQQQVIAEKSMDTETPDKTKFTTVFAREQPDLNSVNPNAGLQTAFVAPTKSVDSPIRTHIVELKDLVDQLVKQLTIVSDPNSGKTDTTLTLKHPPLFAGANVTVTAFKSAKGEFNITFENLNPQAKVLIDLAENQNALRNSLEQKGYMVHIVIATTTTLENTQTVKGEQLGSRQEDESQQQGREGKEEKEG
jgi:hypothetical protein